MFVAPAVALRLTGMHPNPVVSLLAYGAAVVAASFVLAWAAEAAQVDVSGGLAIAVLALIAVLPEYAVDMVFAWKAGHAVAAFGPGCNEPGDLTASPCSLALANMT
ncbi:MAG TPA: hypothetical protein VF477_13060, partial [Mycobacterium sp.]